MGLSQGELDDSSPHPSASLLTVGRLLFASVEASFLLAVSGNEHHLCQFPFQSYQSRLVLILPDRKHSGGQLESRVRPTSQLVEGQVLPVLSPALASVRELVRGSDLVGHC